MTDRHDTGGLSRILKALLILAATVYAWLTLGRANTMDQGNG